MTDIRPVMMEFHDDHPRSADTFLEVVAGLQQTPKVIHPKLFYDERGSELFEMITDLPEYYLARAEQHILHDHAEEIAQVIGRNCLLMEPGSGNCEKVRLLLDALQPRFYVPMDISRDHLRKAAHTLSLDYPWLKVHAACIDFTRPLDLFFCPPEARRIAFFPGSSIGNFEHSEAIRFMRRVMESVGPDGGLLIGVDLKKEKAILEPAYNDSAGITAQFNLNLLRRINVELDADFDLSRFSHRAFYNEGAGRVEMHLVSQIEQTISIGGVEIPFSEGESIHTENSYKYSVAEFQALASRAGFRTVSTWTDDAHQFGVFYLAVAASRSQ